MYLITAGFLLWGAWYINKKWQKVWWLALTLAALGSLTLAASAVGGWAAGVFSLVADMAASLVNGMFSTGISGVMVLGAGAAIGTIIIAADIIKDHKCNKAAIIAFVVTPLLALQAGGLVGDLHAGLRGAGSQAATTAVTSVTGG